MLPCLRLVGKGRLRGRWGEGAHERFGGVQTHPSFPRGRRSAAAGRDGNPGYSLLRHSRAGGNPGWFDFGFSILEFGLEDNGGDANLFANNGK